MDFVQQLKDLDLKTSSPEDVRKIVRQRPLCYVPFTITPTTYILRARKGGGFTKRSQLTYCPVEKCTNYQRATLPGHTMFYGVVSDDQNHLEKARAITIAECSSLCRNGIDSVGQEGLTVSHWEVVKPLCIISLITDDTFLNIQDNGLLNLLRNAYSDIHSEDSEEEKKYTQFICQEFCKTVSEPSEYLISATVATDIIEKTLFDGIVFPSVMLGGQAGLNIALKTTAVNRKLRYVRAIDHMLFKNRKSVLVRMENSTERDGTRRKIFQFSDEMIENELGINSISDLPIV